MSTCRTNLAFFFLACVYSMYAGLTSAQTPTHQADISLTAVSADTTELAPGQLFTWVIRAENLGSAQRTIDIQVDAPAGWTASPSTDEVSLESGQVMLLFVSLRPAETTPADVYQVTVTGSSRNQRGAKSIARSFFKLSAVRTLTLTIEPTDEYIPAGRRVEVEATLTNLSNSIGSGILMVEGSKSFDVSAETRRWTLAPGESMIFSLFVNTDVSAPEQYQGRILLSTAFGGAEGEPLLVSRGFTVVPSNNNVSRNLPEIPLVFTAQVVGNDDETNGQYGVRGSTNALDGQVLLDVLISGGPRTSLYGARDHASLSYTNQYGYLVLGDHAQRLTPLTSSGLFGFGIGGTGQKGRVFGSGTMAKTRFLSPEQTIVGGTVGYQVTSQVSLSANAVSLSGLFNGSFFSGRSQVQFFDRSQQADIECGFDDQSGFDSLTCLVALTGQAAGFSYRARATDISESYPGSRAGLREQSASLGYSVGEGISLSGSVRSTSQAYSDGFRNDQDFYEAGVSFSRPFGKKLIRADVFYLNRDRVYVSVFNTNDRLESAVRSSVMYKNSLGSLRGTLELGTASSNYLEYDGSTWRSRLSASLILSSKISVTASGNYDTGFLVNTPSELTRKSLSLLFTVRMNSHTSVSGGVVKTTNGGIFSSSYSSYRFRFRHRLPFGHEIELAAQAADFGVTSGDIATDFIVSYSVPVGLPDPRRSPNTETIRGRVFDAETGEGIIDVIVYIGDKFSITDASGWFSFPIAGIRSGYISLDQKSIGIDNTPMIDLPIRISDLIDLSIPVDIPIVRSAQVSGTVSLWSREGGDGLLGKQDAPLIQNGQIRGVLLELRSGDTSFRVRTDRSGRFYFRQIPSGTYELRIVSGDLPAGHEFESGSTMVIISPGQASEHHFRVIPTRRNIRMIESGNLEVIERGGTRERREKRRLEQEQLEQE